MPHSESIDLVIVGVFTPVNYKRRTGQMAPLLGLSTIHRSKSVDGDVYSQIHLQPGAQIPQGGKSKNLVTIDLIAQSEFIGLVTVVESLLP